MDGIIEEITAPLMRAVRVISVMPKTTTGVEIAIVVVNNDVEAKTLVVISNPATVEIQLPAPTSHQGETRPKDKTTFLTHRENRIHPNEADRFQNCLP